MSCFSIRFLVLTAIAALTLGVQSAAAHPQDGFQPLLPGGGATWPSTGFPSEWSIGELVFAGEFPSFDTLSPTEQKMLHGAVDNQGRLRVFWRQEVLQFAIKYCALFGRLPEEISPEVYWSTLPPEDYGKYGRFLEVVASPITGRYPRLDAQTFSPGDLYMKVLSESEMRYIADREPGCQQAWFDKRIHGRPVELVCPPIYYRIYGEHGVIFDGITYSTIEQ